MYNRRLIETVDPPLRPGDRGYAGPVPHEDVRASARADDDRLIEVARSAFRADPAARWIYPEGERYDAHFPEFVKAFGGRALTCGTAHVVGDFAGASFWLPPGVHRDDNAVIAHIRRSAPQHIHAPLFALVEQLDRRRPAVPHWHLALLGIDPFHRRKGHGAKLVKHCLKICDEDGFPAYLEAWNAESVGFCQRLGFEVLATVQSGSSPAVAAMLRQPLTGFKNLIPEGLIDLKP